MTKTSTDETWKPIPIEPWDDLYEVSNFGRVRHAPRIVPATNRRGYPSVVLTKQGIEYTVGIHRLVAAAFIRPPRNGEVVNHINADRSDNAIENLEWTTPAGNNAHTAKLGRMAGWGRHPHAKINPAVAMQMRTDGSGLRAIANRFGCSVTAVSNLLRKAEREGRFNDPRKDVGHNDTTPRGSG